MPAKQPKGEKRCPDDFIVTDSLRDWAEKTVPGLDIEWHTSDFMDKEFSMPHKDWHAVWRRWMRTTYLDTYKRKMVAVEAIPPQPMKVAARTIAKPDILTQPLPTNSLTSESFAEARRRLRGVMK